LGTLKINRVILFFLFLGLFSSCNRIGVKEKSHYSHQEKILKIGTDATYPPFEYICGDTGKLIGFDIDLIKKICAELSYKPEFLVVPFDGIIAGLKQKKYDIIISAMTITKERLAEINFSKPYYLAGQSIVVRIDNREIKSQYDLKNKKIGVQLGTTGEMTVKKIFNTTVISYDNISSAFIDLENGRLDAIVNDIPTNRNFVNKKSDKFKIVGNVFTEEKYGIAVRKEDTLLLEKINNVISKLEKQSYLTKLKKTWKIE